MSKPILRADRLAKVDIEGYVTAVDVVKGGQVVETKYLNGDTSRSRASITWVAKSPVELALERGMCAPWATLLVGDDKGMKLDVLVTRVVNKDGSVYVDAVVLDVKGLQEQLNVHHNLVDQFYLENRVHRLTYNADHLLSWRFDDHGLIGTWEEEG